MDVSTVALLAFALLQSADTVEAPQSIRALSECPAELPSSQACVAMPLFSGEGSRLHVSRWEEEASDPGYDEQGFDRYSVRARGRLNGEAEDTVNLTVIRSPITCGGDAFVAVVRLTPDGRPTILTDAGAFQLTEGDLSVGFHRVTLIDPETGSIIGRFLDDVNFHSPFYYHAPDRVTVFDRGTRRCLVALTGGNAVSYADGQCGQAEVENRPYHRPDPESRGLVDYQSGDLDIVRSSMGEDWWEWRGEWAERLVFRMQGHDVIVVEDTSLCT
ncbi:hypothetical protein L5876_00495 [Hyphobacterium sp. SN044]|uniref:hypothetical protein n=1 Tax=Hyphobacterium sp. SN044 TaxID=2912575 RepID=UPI001F188D12|nr:hypothetical protein [Hyphobacterium sp. SN044]MCF8878291.1 hypothetical protein [Hyphobacterium sp. SN044]